MAARVGLDRLGPLLEVGDDDHPGEVLAVLVAGHGAEMEAAAGLDPPGPLDDVAPLEEEPPARVGEGVRVLERLAKHPDVVLVHVEAAVARQAVRPVRGGAEQHVPAPVEHALEGDVHADVVGVVAVRVREHVAVAAERRGPPVVDGERSIVDRVEEVGAEVRDLERAVVGERHPLVHRRDEVGVAALEAGGLEPPARAHAEVEPEHQLARNRRGQVGIDAALEVRAGAGAGRRHEPPDLAGLEPAIAVAIVPAVDVAGRRPRVAPGQVPERQAVPVEAVAEEGGDAAAVGDLPLQEAAREERPPADDPVAPGRTRLGPVGAGPEVEREARPERDLAVEPGGQLGRPPPNRPRPRLDVPHARRQPVHQLADEGPGLRGRLGIGVADREAGREAAEALEAEHGVQLEDDAVASARPGRRKHQFGNGAVEQPLDDPGDGAAAVGGAAGVVVLVAGRGAEGGAASRDPFVGRVEVAGRVGGPNRLQGKPGAGEEGVDGAIGRPDHPQAAFVRERGRRVQERRGEPAVERRLAAALEPSRRGRPSREENPEPIGHGSAHARLAAARRPEARDRGNAVARVVGLGLVRKVAGPQAAGPGAARRPRHEDERRPGPPQVGREKGIGHAHRLEVVGVELHQRRAGALGVGHVEPVHLEARLRARTAVAREPLALAEVQAPVGDAVDHDERVHRLDQRPQRLGGGQVAQVNLGEDEARHRARGQHAGGRRRLPRRHRQRNGRLLGRGRCSQQQRQEKDSSQSREQGRLHQVRFPFVVVGERSGNE